MFTPNIFKFWELSNEAQSKALAKLASKFYDELKSYGFTNLVRRKNALNKIAAFLRNVVLHQFLEDGTPVLIPVYEAKPATSLSAALRD